jgi:hypothetical protein
LIKAVVPGAAKRLLLFWLHSFAGKKCSPKSNEWFCSQEFLGQTKAAWWFGTMEFYDFPFSWE